tara:strand:- start:1676 stop:1912 length:237 start_codon:yes stop_codon:yes gene_type:complete
VQDLIEGEITPEKYVADPFESYPIEIKENEERTQDPLIDEPVTGAGNDDLWVNGSDCAEGDSEKCQTEDDQEQREPAE